MDVRRFQELLGGHATSVQTGATDLVALDDGDVETGRGAVEGCGVTAGSSSDYDDIELLDLVNHRLSLRLHSAIPQKEILMFLRISSCAVRLNASHESQKGSTSVGPPTRDAHRTNRAFGRRRLDRQLHVTLPDGDVVHVVVVVTGTVVGGT